MRGGRPGWRIASLLSFIFLLQAPCASALVVNGFIYPHAVALFGPRPSPIEGERACLAAPRSSPLGCDKSAYDGVDVNNKIALVRRGDCKFVEKVTVAQELGAKAVLIYDNGPASSLLFMSSAGEPLSTQIPAASIFYVDGIMFNETLSIPEQLYVVLNATGVEEQQYNNDELMSSALRFLFQAFLVIWGLGFMVAMLRCTRRYCARRSRLQVVKSLRRRKFRKGECDEDAAAAAEDEPAVTAASVSVETSVDDVRISLTSNDSLAENTPSSSPVFLCESCVICLCDFEEGEMVTVLPCRHSYHRECIEPWLIKKSALCPICKQSVLPDGDPRPIAEGVEAEEGIEDTEDDDDGRNRSPWCFCALSGRRGRNFLMFIGLTLVLIFLGIVVFIAGPGDQ